MRLGVLLALAACGSTSPAASTARPSEPAPVAAAPAAALSLDDLPGMWLDQVAIEGIDDEHVLAAVRSRRGDRADLARIRADVLAIYATGMVQDVRAEAWRQGTGAALRYVVEPLPRLRAVRFAGNDRIATADLRAELRTVEARSVRPEAVHRDARRIAELYRARGYLDAAVAPDVADGTVTFEIDEGQMVTIGTLSFTGNRAVPGADLIRLIASPGVNTVGGRYDPELLRDREPLIDAHYFDRGYVEMRLGEPIVIRSADGLTLAVTIPVHEGRQYRIGTLTASGSLSAPVATYVRALGVKTGQIFNRDTFTAGLVRVRILHARYGSIPEDIVEVVPKTTLRKDARRVDIDVYVGTIGPVPTPGRLRNP